MELDALFVGIVAGFAAAIPTGAASIALLELAMRRGQRHATIAGAGIAVVDTAFAALAVLIGRGAADAIAPYQASIGLAGGLIIAIVGAAGLRRSRRELAQDEDDPPPTSLARSFVTLAVLTAVNPATVGFFVLVIVGNAWAFEGGSSSWLFIAGVGAACMTWETVLAMIGAYSSRNAGLALKQKLSVAGNALVLVLGVGIAAYGLVQLTGLAATLGLGASGSP